MDTQPEVALPTVIPPSREEPPVPVPAGPAAIAAFSGPEDHLAGMFHVITARIGLAIDERWAATLIPPPIQGREHVEALLARDEPVAPELEAAWHAQISQRAALVERRLLITRERGGTLPLVDALDAWQLSSVDRTILGCLLGAELSPTIARLLAYLGGEAVHTRRPSFEAVAAVLGAGSAGVAELTARLAADAPLSRLALVGFGGTLEHPLLRRILVVNPRLAALARGEVALDEQLRVDGVELQRARETSLAIRHAPVLLCQRLRATFVRPSSQPVTVVSARRGVGALAIVADAALSIGRPALRIRGGAIRPELAWLDAIAREALLHRAVVVIEHDGRPVAPLLHRFAGLPTPIAIACDAGHAGPVLDGIPAVHVELGSPGAAARAVMWGEAIPIDERGADLDLAGLSASARVGGVVIERAAANARAVAAAAGQPRLSREDVMDGLRAQLPGLSRIARRVPHPPGWDALVLPGDVLDQVFELVYGAREHRVFADLGGEAAQGAMIAMITGAPGTGKTTVAALLAKDLGLDLVELDVPSLAPGDAAVERGLEAAFVAAEAGLALIAFDRAEVVPAWLLRRLRHGSGVVVLMASTPEAVSPEVRGAVTAQIELPFPSQEDRERLWIRAFPAEALLADALPHDQLAREHKLTGGQIRSVAVRASALAIAANQPVNLETVRAIARRLR